MKKSRTYTQNLRISTKREIIKQLAIKQNPLAFFKPQEYQKPFFDSLKKNRAIFGGNRSGKTMCGAAYVIDYLLKHPETRGRASTWADMSVPIQQTKIYELLPKNGLVKYASFSEKRGFTNRIIIFANGSTLRFKTYDQGRESFQGSDLDFEWDDEEPPEDIVSEQKARLIDRNGTLLRTMTPLNGITYTYDDVVLNERNDPEVEYWFFDNRNNQYINQEALQRTINSYAAKEAEVRQQGHFLNLNTGNAYYPFSEANIIESFDYMNYRPLEISCDFNVDLMCWGIGQELNDSDYLFDFVELEGQANTDLLCQMLKNKYPQHEGGWIFYGDIAGNARRPEASKTNWAIIREHFPHAKIYYQDIKNIKDRIDATNARLKNNQGIIKSFITKNCKRHTKDYRQVTWEHLLNKNKAGRLTHATDGESYKFFWKYDLRGKPSTIVGNYA